MIRKSLSLFAQTLAVMVGVTLGAVVATLFVTLV